MGNHQCHFQDLVISGFENGIGDSPHKGLTKLTNANVTYIPGVAYANYKRQPASATPGTGAYSLTNSTTQFNTSVTPLNVGDAFTVNTTGGGLTSGTTYFIVSGSGGVYGVSATRGGSAISFSAGTSGTMTVTTMNPPRNSTINPSTGTIYVVDNIGQVWDNSLTKTYLDGSTLPYYTLLTGNTLTNGNGNGIVVYKGFLLVFRQGAIDSYDFANSTWYNSWVANTSITFTGSLSAGAMSATISSGSGSTWAYASGVYLMTTSNNQQVVVNVTNGSGTVSWSVPLGTNATATVSINLFSGTPNSNYAIWAQDDIVYFCNGSYIGNIESTTTTTALPFQATSTYITGSGANYATVSFSALGLPSYETSSFITELSTQLYISCGNSGTSSGVGNKIYPWDNFSKATSFGTPVPINEVIWKTVNLKNVLYVFAGYKGNIYQSNSYSASVFKKIPDSIVGVIDPVWVIGGVTGHRNKLYFGALGYDPKNTSTNFIGTLSLDLVSGVFEIVNTPSSAYTFDNSNDNVPVLIDQNQLSVYDTYVSSWNSGNSVGGMDYNDSTPDMAILESDAIPIGTTYQQKTFASAEFKLDKPMQSGDVITLYARPYLATGTTAYVELGQTTTTVLSDFYSGVPFQEWQWIQFKATLTSGATGQFPRIKEVRIR